MKKNILLTIIASFIVGSVVLAVTSYSSVYNSSDGGMIYGSIYTHDSATTTSLLEQDTPVQVTNFFFDGLSNGATPDHTNDHITILTSGVYDVNANPSFMSANSNDYEFHIAINNNATIFHGCHTSRTTSVASSIGASNLNCQIALTANDTVELWVSRTNGGTPDKTITINSVNLNVKKIND